MFLNRRKSLKTSSYLHVVKDADEMDEAKAVYAAWTLQLEDCIAQFVELILRESDDLLNPILIYVILFI